MFDLTHFIKTLISRSDLELSMNYIQIIVEFIVSLNYQVNPACIMETKFKNEDDSFNIEFINTLTATKAILQISPKNIKFTEYFGKTTTLIDFIKGEVKSFIYEKELPIFVHYEEYNGKVIKYYNEESTIYLKALGLTLTRDIIYKDALDSIVPDDIKLISQNADQLETLYEVIAYTGSIDKSKNNEKQF